MWMLQKGVNLKRLYPNAIYESAEAYYSEEQDIYFSYYVMCYSNEEFVVTLEITEMSQKDMEDSAVLIGAIGYYTPASWEVQCNYYGY